MRVANYILLDPLSPDSGGESPGGSVTSAGSASFGAIVAPTERARAPVQTAGPVFGKIRLSTISERVWMKVATLDTATVYVRSITVNLSGTNYAGLAVTIQHRVSTDGLNWIKLPSSTDITAEGTFTVTVTGWPYYGVEVTTASGTVAYAEVVMTAKSNS